MCAAWFCSDPLPDGTRFLKKTMLFLNLNIRAIILAFSFQRQNMNNALTRGYSLGLLRRPSGSRL
jgi:hypothetical protein